MIDMRTLLLLTAILAGSTVAQDPVPSPSVNLHPAKAGAQHWIQQLGSDSYRDRLEAENKLRELGGEAKAALESAAKDESDGEVQWRAKRLLRQLEKAQLREAKSGAGKGTRPGLVERRSADRDQSSRDQSDLGQGPTIERRRRDQDVGGLGGVDDMRNRFDRLFRRMEKMHGLDVPRHRFFDDTFFNDLKAQMERGQLGLGQSGLQSSGNSTSVQVGPNGVHVEVTETDKDGKQQTKIYDAPDMETFRKLHPDVLPESRGGLMGGGLGLQSFGRSNMSDLLDELRVDATAPQRGFDWKLLKPRVVPFDQGFRPQPGQQPGQKPGQPGGPVAAPVPPAGRRLGIQIKPIPAALRDYLEMDPEVGLMVDAVQKDTLAEALRLRSGDIVTKINGSKIGSAADVQKALGAIKKGADVEVEFLRRGDRREATTKKQHDAQATREVLEPGRKQRVRESIR